MSLVLIMSLVLSIMILIVLTRFVSLKGIFKHLKIFSFFFLFSVFIIIGVYFSIATNGNGTSPTITLTETTRTSCSNSTVSETTIICREECLDWDSYSDEELAQLGLSEENRTYCAGGYAEVCRNNTLSSFKTACNETRYSAPMYYHNGTQYVPIETNFVNTSCEINYDYCSITGEYEVHIKEDPTEGQVVKFVKNNTEITFQPMALNYRNDLSQIEQISMIQGVTGSNSSNIFIYEGAYGSGIDLKYYYYTDNLKEGLILENSSVLPTPAQYIIDGGNATLDLDFILSTNSQHFVIDGFDWDKTTTTSTNNEVYVKDDNNKTLYYLPKPYASDSNHTQQLLTYQFKKSGNSLYVIIKTPYSWLNDTNRIYPINIDPTVKLQTNDTELLEDTWTQAKDNENYNSGTSPSCITKGGYFEWYCYMKFIVPDLPNGSTISQVLLTTNHDTGAGTNTSVYHVYNQSWKEGDMDGENCNVSSDCDDGLVYSRQPCGPGFVETNSCNLTGMDSHVNVNESIVWNVTSGFQYDYDNNSENFSVAFKYDVNSTANFLYMLSKEDPNTSGRPLLNITYSYGPASFNTSACTVLDTAGTYYLTGHIRNSTISNCMDITAGNITLDCQGYMIDGDDTADYGINIERDSSESTNITIKNCTLTDWDTAAINLDYAGNNTLTNLTITSTPNQGIYAYGSDGINITNSIIYSSLSRGVQFSSSNYILIENVTSKDNPNEDILILTTQNDCDYTFNNVNGTNDLPIVFFNTQVEFSGWNNNASAIILCNADNSIISNITMDAGSTKDNNYFYIIETENLTLSNSSFNNMEGGIDLINSQSNRFFNLSFNSTDYYPLYIQLGSNSNNFSNINITESEFVGIYISASDNNLIVNSTMHMLNDYHPIRSASPNVNNTFYNNLFNSSDSVPTFSGATHDFFWNTTNQTGDKIFGNGLRIGGNFWAYPNGSGYSETCTDTAKDGFCDTPYNITSGLAAVGTGGNIDYLPLSDEYDALFPSWSTNSTNATALTTRGDDVQFNMTWQDEANLTLVQFAWNTTGSWANITNITYSGTTALNFSVNQTISVAEGSTIYWRFSGRDTLNWNNSDIFNFTTYSENPSWSTNSTNLTATTTTNNVVQFNITWIDNVNISTVQLSWNDSGSWVNTTNLTIDLSSVTASFNETITAAENTTVYWRFHANDTSNNWNNSDEFNFTVADITAPIFSSNSTNLTSTSTTDNIIQFNITWTDAISVSTTQFSWNDTGSWVNVTNLTINNGSITSSFNETITAAQNTTVYWRFHANDSYNNWNNSDLYSFKVADITNPSWTNSSSNETSSTTKGHDVQFNVTWTDNIGLSTVGLAWNGSGSWINITNLTIFNTSILASFNETITAAEGTTVYWKTYANDTSNNWNESDEYNFTLYSENPGWSSNNTNNTAPAVGETIHFNITWTDNVNVSTAMFSWNDTGSWVNVSNVTLNSKNKRADFYQTITATLGTDVYYRFHANDTSNLWNNTPVISFTVGDIVSPYWSVNSTNVTSTTSQGMDVQLNMTWADVRTNVSAVIFSWNDTGSWANTTLTSINNASIIASINKTITAEEGSAIHWKMYANDSYNNLNESVSFNFTVSQTAPTWSSNSTNNSAPSTGQDVQFNITWTDNVNVSTAMFSWNASGTWVNASNFTVDNTSILISVNQSIDPSYSTAIHYRFHANDSQGSWANSPSWNLTASDGTYPGSYSNLTNDSSIWRNDTVEFSVQWVDNRELDTWIFNSNFSGVAVNYTVNSTWGGLGTNISNVTYQINVTKGKDFFYRFYVNDTSNNWNETEQFVFTIQNAGVNILEAATIPPSPKFANNLTIQINISDVDNDINWVNFTLYYPNGSTKVINSQNGTRIGKSWNSSFYVINQTGTWNWSVNISEGTYINSTNGSFSITDVVVITPQWYKQTMNISATKTCIINITHDSDTTLFFNFSDNLNFSAFNVSYSNYSIKVQNNSYNDTIMNVTSGPLASSGTYFTNVTVLRNFSNTGGVTETNYTIPLNITISTELLGEITVVNASNEDWTFSMYDTGNQTHSWKVNNTGDYTLSSCEPSLSDLYADLSNYTTFNMTPFVLSVGQVKHLALTFTEPPVGIYIEYLIIECTADSLGNKDTLDTSEPKIYLTVTDAPVEEEGGGVGGGEEEPRRQPKTINITKYIEKSVCGDGICQDDESPFICNKDCKWNMDVLFCWRGAHCAWRTAWFAKVLVFLLLASAFAVIIAREIILKKKRRRKSKKSRRSLSYG